jgi:hypothetical protein
MKVLDILLEAEKNLQSSEDLANAFKPGEWYNIIAHFTSRGGKPIDNSDFARVNKEVGHQMYRVIDPSSWNFKASLYKMSAPQERPTWNDIYNHLKPFADKTAAPPTNSGEKPRPLALPTKEPFSAFQTWAKGAETFTDRTELRQYMISLTNAISAKRDPEWSDFLNSPNKKTGNLDYIDDFKKMNKDIHNSLATNKSITKQDVDSEYYAWLNTVDRGLTEFKKMPPKPTPNQ